MQREGEREREREKEVETEDRPYCKMELVLAEGPSKHQRPMMMQPLQPYTSWACLHGYPRPLPGFYVFLEDDNISTCWYT